MPKKVRRIKVRTTIGIAEEMCRYDNATIVDKANPSDIRRIPKGHIEMFQKWDFTIDCPYQVTEARWRSFGVKVHYL